MRLNPIKKLDSLLIIQSSLTFLLHWNPITPNRKDLQKIVLDCGLSVSPIFGRVAYHERWIGPNFAME